MKTRKTDNGNLSDKLHLRRKVLDEYFGKKQFSVFDCCQGKQVIWKYLRREYKCRYMGVDVKPEKGRLKIDSRRLLQINADKFDVIDIDTYGSPVQHIKALLPLVKKRVILFLTYGQLRVGGGNYDHAIKKALGIPFEIPNAIGVSLSFQYFDQILAGTISAGIKIVECIEAPRSRNARYLALVVAPQ